MTGVLAAVLLVIAVPQDTEPRVLLRLDPDLFKNSKTSYF